MTKNYQKILSALCICLVLSNLTLSSLFSKNSNKANRMLAVGDNDTTSDTNNDDNKNAGDDDTNQPMTTNTKLELGGIGAAALVSTGTGIGYVYSGLRNEQPNIAEQLLQEPEVQANNDALGIDGYLSDFGTGPKIDLNDESMNLMEDGFQASNDIDAPIDSVTGVASTVNNADEILDVTSITGVADTMVDAEEVATVVSSIP